MIKQNTWKEIKALKTQLEVTILLIRARAQPQSQIQSTDSTRPSPVKEINSQQLPRLHKQPKTSQTQEDDISPDAGQSSAFHTAPAFPTLPKKRH